MSGSSAESDSIEGSSLPKNGVMNSASECLPKVDAVPDANQGAKPQGANRDGEGVLLSLVGKWAFPYLLSVSVAQFGIYLNKLYEDSAAVAVYFDERDVSYCIASASCLFIPAFLYIVYIVSLYIKQQEQIETKEIGTKIVHGMLLVPWQIKGRVELLHFSAQKICQKRVLSDEEITEKCNLERQASLLEFFGKFYAGFIQLVLQMYIIIISLDKDIHSKALPSEIVASGLTLITVVNAVKRTDDGILTGFLSEVGWLSILVSRSVSIALATTVIHGWMVLICLLHGVLISLWLSSISLKSYRTADCLPYSSKRKVALFFVIFTVFGLPSLIYWPIMFQLKKAKRVFAFLFIMLLENCAFFAIWHFLGQREEWARHHYILVPVMAGGYIVGTLFILLYICCKPKYTDNVVYHDMKVQNSESFGMYFEFCDVAFKLPRKESLVDKLQRVRGRKCEA